MKKVFFILLGLMFAICSCVKESGTFDVQNNVDQDDQIIFVDPYRVTMDDLFEYLSITNTAKTKGDAAVKSIKPIKHDNDTVMYFIERNKGWEIISADKRAGVVMAYSVAGTESLEDLQSNPNINTWLSIRSEMVSLIRKANFIEDNDNTEQWAHLLNDIKQEPQTKTIIDGQPGWKKIGTMCYLDLEQGCQHQIETKWGQQYPWNTCVPFSGSQYIYRCNGGCVPVAMAQMLYWTNQKYGIPTYSFTSASCTGYSNRDGQDYCFNFIDSSTTAWSNMAKNVCDYTNNYSYVAYLIGKVGQIMSAKYNINGTEMDIRGTSVMQLSWIMNRVGTYYGINYDYGQFNGDTILSYLVYYSKPSVIICHNTLGGAHMWIIDGYSHQRWAFDDYYIYDPDNTYNPDIIEEEMEDPDETGGYVYIPDGYEVYIQTRYWNNIYFLMNWGYDGFGDDAYYWASDEATWSIDTFHYNQKVKMITNFRQ